jgi:hypothetical protein
MNVFINDLYSLYKLIKNEPEQASIFNSKLIEKQYLGYYIYRVIYKFKNILSQQDGAGKVQRFFDLLNIPFESRGALCYPMARRFPVDDVIVDTIILAGLDILNYSQSVSINAPVKSAYNDINNFCKIKHIKQIIIDILDLLKLVPNLSLSSIKPVVRIF